MTGILNLLGTRPSIRGCIMAVRAQEISAHRLIASEHSSR
jgi:hypothetical protein